MKLKALYVIFVLKLFLACNTIPDQEQKPLNVSKISSDYLIQSVLWFQHSAEMRASYYQVYNMATRALDEKLKNTAPETHPAVVLDIDETVLDNSPFEGYLIKNDSAYNKELWLTWTNMKKAASLPGALNFISQAKEHGVEIFYVTNRRQIEQEATIENLKEQGFPFADTIHVLCRTDEAGKQSRRDKILKTHTILLLIGDNLSDLSKAFDTRNDEGYSAVDSLKEHFGNDWFLLPNPMYGDWEKAALKSKESNDSIRKSVLIGYYWI